MKVGHLREQRQRMRIGRRVVRLMNAHGWPRRARDGPRILDVEHAPPQARQSLAKVGVGLNRVGHAAIAKAGRAEHPDSHHLPDKRVAELADDDAGAGPHVCQEHLHTGGVQPVCASWGKVRIGRASRI